MFLCEIFSQDLNEHAPVFEPSDNYLQSIDETTPPFSLVETIVASDADVNPPNGNVTYRIITGAQYIFHTTLLWFFHKILM